MNATDAKDFIIKNWSVSSGARIKEMLLRYKQFFFEKNINGKKNIVDIAQDIFGGKIE